MEPKRLKIPLREGDVRALNVGDLVLLSGPVVSGRDRVHKFLFNERPGRESIPFDLSGGVLYHCGPIIRREDGGYRLIAAGPTTSQRVEIYEWWLIREYGLRGIMGKGGMGERTLRAMKESGCVYLHTIGGAAVYLAERIKRVVDGWMIEEFGAAEAMWLFEVEDFPAIVTMDARGGSLHRAVAEESRKRLVELLRPGGA